MDFGIANKTAVVLGAGGWLGSAIAGALADEGVKVALGDINLDAAEENASRIRANGGQAIALAWDLGELAQIDANISRIEAELGPVDVLKPVAILLQPQ